MVTIIAHKSGNVILPSQGKGGGQNCEGEEGKREGEKLKGMKGKKRRKNTDEKNTKTLDNT